MMVKLYNYFLITLCVVSFNLCFDTPGAQIGVNYGTLGSNLPLPTEVLALCIKHNIRSIRIFDPDPLILTALKSYPNISVVVGVKNLDIPSLGTNVNTAKLWVNNNIVKYRGVNFKYITVGNEINPLDKGSSAMASNIGSAMQNIYNALPKDLRTNVKISTVLGMVILGNSSPPSAGAFHPDISGFINPIVRILAQIQAPLIVNVYPYFAYAAQPQKIRLDYALFTASSPVVNDGKYQYQNLFSAMVDAIYAALEKANGANVGLAIGETGWPSAFGIHTTIKNAETYVSNLIKYVKNGTPRKPNKAIETYIFSLFDENKKSPELEKHWGLFLPNKQPKYSISLK